MSNNFALSIEDIRRLNESKVERGFEITKSNTENLAHPTTAIYVGETGNIKLELYNGDIITLNNLAAGAWHPISAIKVFETDTTCTGIVGAY